MNLTLTKILTKQGVYFEIGRLNTKLNYKIEKTNYDGEKEHKNKLSLEANLKL